LIDDTAHGVHLNMPADKYHALPGTSASTLRAYWKQTPAHAKVFLETHKETPAMIRGTVAHQLLLEPEKGLAGVAVLPDTYPGEDAKGRTVQKDWNGNATYCRDYIASAKLAGLLPIKSDEYLHAVRAVQSVLNGPAGEYYTEGWGEVSVIVHDEPNDASVRCRIDWLPRHHRVIADLKVTQDASEEDFAKTVWEQGYHIQAAVNLDAWNAVAGQDDPRTHFDFIAVEPFPPYAVKVHRLSQRMIALGRMHAAELLALHCRCVLANHWPAYDPTVNLIEPKDWQLNATATATRGEA
jgi:hypothetical protein